MEEEKMKEGRGDDCKDKPTLCDRAQCVTDTWFTIRSRKDKRDADWVEYWKDIGLELEKLSTAITTESTRDDNLCEGITVADNKTEGANKKACNYIVKGLKYIYSIDLSHKQNEQDHPYLNQQFQQTVVCLLLNEFARRMEEQAKELPCSIDKGIEKGFGFMGKIKSDACKSGYPCVECGREKDYSEKCEVGEKKLWDGVKEKINGKKNEIDKTLNAICQSTPKPEEEAPVASEEGAERVEEEKEEEEEEEEEQEEEQEPGPSEEAAGGAEGALGAGGSKSSPGTPPVPSPAKLVNMKDNPFLPYLPLAPAIIGISAMSYILWKYFGMLRKGRKRYRRAHQEQIIQHIEEDGPHAYTLVKERRHPRSTPEKRRKKRGVDRRAGRRGVRGRMIIDIHLEVLNECQKGDLHSTKEDFFEILVQEFMGSEFIKEDFLPKEQVPSSDSGFREGKLYS
ncbi:SICA antigen [Plasmodium coatneyi]|uniref:SICA antigen n=1 Tax=Plasmodium coatneyi TaxID=208452 RepID=A0A1B1E5Q2_9APIC|nr:SICA antigen [Plasmodium coatneyi]ANQ10362.1 SICA antigen [Plasmodium coatneyi]